MNKNIIKVECDCDMHVTLQVSRTTIIDSKGQHQAEPEAVLVVEDLLSEDENCLAVVFTSSQVEAFIDKLRELKKRL